jgi:serine/threonine protein kinase
VEELEGFSDWQEIGRGGDAIVYRAIQDSLGREVAIKVLTVDDDESVRRFTREVRLMVALGRRHPNIAKVIQIGTSSLGRPCIVMEYYELGSLDQWLSRMGPLNPDEVIRVGTVIADALDFAHGDGVLHRDVKPQNILVLPTSYVLADFGIARLIDSAHTSGSDRFSYRHASPQMLDGLPASESDDVFSLGATMFHLLDGHPPFTTSTDEPDSALAYIRRVRVEKPRPLNRPDVPPELVEVIERCLRKEPGERFRTAGEVRDRLLALPVDALNPAPNPARAEVPLRPPIGVKPTAAGSPESPDTPTHAPLFTVPPPDLGVTWDVARGQVRDPGDLTAMRLGSSRGAKVNLDAETNGAEGLLLADVTEPVPEAPGRQLPGIAIVLVGIVVGVLLVVGGTWAVNRPGPGVHSPSVPAPAPSSARAPVIDPNNPDLAPRDMTVTLSGNIATAKWRGAIEEPESYSWGVTANPGDEVPIERRTLPSERMAQTTINPTWEQICFTVVGTRAGELGAAQECVRR